MKNKKPGTLKKPIPGFILPVVIILTILVLIVILYYKYSGNNTYRVIKVKGVSTVSNLSKLELFAYSSLANDSACYSLVENGDLIAFDNVLYEVSSASPDSLNILTKEDTAVYLNGRLYTIIINEKANLVPFLKSLSEKDIHSLSNLQIQEDIPGTYIPWLKNIAQINKEVSLYFEEDSGSVIMKNYFAKANFFNPRIFSGNINSSFYPQISGLSNIRILFISIKDSITTPLPYLPNLESCIIIDAGEKGFPMVMKNNRHASLWFPDTEFFPNNELRKFKSLPMLQIKSSDSAVLEGLDDKITNTSTLVITSDNSRVSGELKKFSNVKWLTTSGDFSTAPFKILLSGFENIRVLEINANYALSSYQSLAELHSLHALIIRDTVTDFNSLSSLKQLKYLSLPHDLYSDSTKLNSLKKALPGCIIAPNAGACLGSAWLLLIPVIALFKFYFNRKILQLKIH